MKQIIIITGNVATGKTTLAKHLKKLLPAAFTYVCLDASRLWHHGTLGSAEKENAAASNDVVKNLITRDLIIFENSGSTQFFTRMMEIIQARKVPTFHIHLQVDPQLCIQRSQHRKKYQFQVPPVNGKLSLEGFIHRCHRNGIQQTPDLTLNSKKMNSEKMAAEVLSKLNSKTNGRKHS